MKQATRDASIEYLLDLLALGAGSVSVFAFAPFQYAALAPVSLFLLFQSWHHATTLRASIRGYLFGLGQFGTGAHWVYISMHDYSGADAVEASGLTVLFVASLALYPALAGWLSLRLGRSVAPAWSKAVLQPAVWVGVEWFRGWFLTGFPWLQIGYTQIDTLLGQALAPLGGVYAVSLCVALLAGLLVVVFDATQGRWSRIAATLAVPALVGACHPLSQMIWTQPVGHPIAVALLQGNISQQLKWQPAIKQATLTKYRDLTRQNWDARLIIWPETAVPAFLHQVKQDYLADLQAEATEHGTDVLIGIPVMSEATRRYSNALVSLTPEAGAYHKRHMVPFGEYLPLRRLFGFVLDMLQIPLADFEPGAEHQPPLRAVGYPLGASICFEDVFGYEVRKFLPEAAFLVNVTNDAWFGNSIEPFQHHQMARMRALETGRYLLRATNTGITSIIAPTGQVVMQSPQFWEGALRGQFQAMAGATPYVRWGDVPLIGLIGFTLAILRLLSRLHEPGGEAGSRIG